MTPLLWTIRFASALGFASLSLTGEISQLYTSVCWIIWMASFWLDRAPDLEKRISRWETLAVLVLVSVFLLDFFHWGYSIFVSVAHFLLVFQVFKLVGTKSRKDCMQMLIFSFFQMLSACTLSVDIWQAVILLLLIPTAASGLFWQQINREAEESGQPLPVYASKPYRKWAAGVCLAAIPVNLLFAGMMFMIFPRLAFRGAFAGLGTGRSGYNEQVNLSQTGVVGTDNSAVLWLEIMPPQDRAKWKGYLRGGTLDFFDGKKWNRSSLAVAQTVYADTNGVFKLATGHQGLRQSITLVNSAGATLFGSPTIGEIIAPLATLQAMADGSIRWTQGWRKPLRYGVVSFEQPLPSGFARHAPNYLQLPNIPLARTQALVHQIATQRSSLSKAKAIETYLHSHYAYTLDQGTALSENPVEDFLFVRRRGPCGHFASAMAVMLRLQGIPSRVVAGYYKGTWNDRAQQILMRERDAHAWVEAFIPGTGWVSFDPTPRVNPLEVTQRWLLRLQENWDYLNYQWDRLVIEYDLYSQVEVIKGVQSNTSRVNALISRWMERLMGTRSAISNLRPQKSLRSGVLGLKFEVVVLIMLAGLIVWSLRRRAAIGDPAIAFYQKFLNQMAKKGYPKIPSETGLEYAERLRVRPESNKVVEITRQYYQVRFASIKKPELK